MLWAQPSARPGNASLPEQVVPVAVRREQPARRGEAGLARAAPAARSSSSGSTGESITKALGAAEGSARRNHVQDTAGRHALPAAAAHDHAVRGQHSAGDEDHIRVQGYAPARAQVTPSSFAASLRFATSAVGFFWEESSVSLLRFTQITGTRALTHGTTSW